MAELRTERLLLRHWRSSDREPFAVLNADAEVMRHYPAPLSREQSDAFADRIEASLTREGWGLWVLEEHASGRFIGFTGLARPDFDAPFMPAVEIGWRLARDAWGQGFATEAAREATRFAFDDLALEELVSFTTVRNVRSQAVMRRLGMQHDVAGDFEHPNLPVGHPLRQHLLHRLLATGWRASTLSA